MTNYIHIYNLQKLFVELFHLLGFELTDREAWTFASFELQDCWSKSIFSMPNLGTEWLIGVGWAAGGGQVGRHPLPCAMASTCFWVWHILCFFSRKPSIFGPKVFANKQDLMHASTAPEISEALGGKRVLWAWLTVVRLQMAEHEVHFWSSKKSLIKLGHVSQGFLLSTCQAWRAFRIASGRSRHAVRRPGKAYRKVWNGWCSPARRTEPGSTTTQWASEHCGWHTCHGRGRIGSIKIL